MYNRALIVLIQSYSTMEVVGLQLSFVSLIFPLEHTYKQTDVKTCLQIAPLCSKGLLLAVEAKEL